MVTPMNDADHPALVWYAAQLDATERLATAAQAVNPTPWTATDWGWVEDSRDSGRPEYAGLWDCEGASSLCMDPATAAHVAFHDPERVLWQVAVMRRRLERHSPGAVWLSGPTGCMWCSSEGEFAEWPCPDVRDDLSVFADRSGYPLKEGQ